MKNFVRAFALISTLALLSGCIITPRVEMTERIDFNYHAPAAGVMLSSVDQMCAV
jgi:hypothetical protein